MSFNCKGLLQYNLKSTSTFCEEHLHSSGTAAAPHKKCKNLYNIETKHDIASKPEMFLLIDIGLFIHMVLLKVIDWKMNDDHRVDKRGDS